MLRNNDENVIVITINLEEVKYSEELKQGKANAHI